MKQITKTIWAILFTGLFALQMAVAQTGFSGRITAADGTTPVADAYVECYQYFVDGDYWDYVNYAYSDANGEYTVDTGGGLFRFSVSGSVFGDYVTEWFNNATSLETATNVTVAANAYTTGRNVSLTSTYGAISGTVTSQDGVTPLEDTYVTVYRYVQQYNQWEEVSGTYTGPDGSYEISSLEQGDYRVGFQGSYGLYVSEYYDGAADVGSAMNVSVTSGFNTRNIDASLVERYGSLSGTVTGQDGVTPLEDIDVSAYRYNDETTEWDYQAYAYSGPDGTYSFSQLEAGTYRLQFQDYSYYLYQTAYYENSPDLDGATNVAVAGGMATSDIDMALTERYGSLSGTVTGQDGVTPLEDILVRVYSYDEFDDDWYSVSYAYTGPDGTYSFSQLEAGTYRVEFQDDNYYLYLSEYYENVPDLISATNVSVAGGVNTNSIDASLGERYGRLSGTVTGQDGVTPLEDIYVRVYIYDEFDDYWWSVSSAYSGPDGTYSFSQLEPGTYRVQFQDDTNYIYLAEYYDNALVVESATDVPVVAGITASNIDASLALRYGSLSGTVTGPDGVTPLSGIEVVAYQYYDYGDGTGYWDYVSDAYTQPDGSYNFSELEAGTYRIGFFDYDYDTYVTEYYNNAPDQESAQDIVIVGGEDTSGINASLGVYGSISGTVTGPDGVTPLTNISVEVYKEYYDEFSDSSYWEAVRYGYTSSNGQYSVTGLSPGTYRVGFSDQDEANYVTEFYDDALSVESAADVVLIESEAKVGIDASLAIGGSLTGRVAGPTGVVALRNIEVQIYHYSMEGETGSWEWIRSVYTGTDGLFFSDGLRPGTYRVGFYDQNEVYSTQFFSNAGSLETATDIVIVAGEEVAGINASLLLFGVAWPEIAVEEPDDHDLADGTAAISYGDSTVGVPVVKTFTVRNPGTANLTGLALSLSGTNSSDFALGSLGATSLPPGASTTFTVTFTPTAGGARSAALQVASNDTNENPFDIALNGNGILSPAPEIVVEEPVGSGLVDDAASLTYTASDIGTTVIKTVTIRNIGTANLTGLVVTLGGTNAADFSAGPLGATTLAPQATTTFTVTFAPTAAGVRSGAIQIASNDADENPFGISLAGTGVIPPAPEIVVEEPVNTNLVDGTAALVFGNSNIGIAVTKTFTVRNTGTANLTGIAVTPSGTNASEFVVGALAATTVAPGASMTFTVTFTPTAAGARSAAIQIASNDADENPFNIAMSGTGLEPAAPEIAVTQGKGKKKKLTDNKSTRDFGSVKVKKSSKAMEFTIKNEGNATLKKLKITFKGKQAKDFKLVKKPKASLAPGKTVKFKVIYKPSKAKTSKTTLQIASTDKDENPFRIGLTGKGSK